MVDAPVPSPDVLRPPRMEGLWDRFDTAYPASALGKVVHDVVHESTMQARIDQISLHPGVAPDAPIDCGDGLSPYKPGLPLTSRAPRASTATGDQARRCRGQTYAVHAQAFWRVMYNCEDGDGVRVRTLGMFDIATMQRLAVQTVQCTS